MNMSANGDNSYVKFAHYIGDNINDCYSKCSNKNEGANFQRTLSCNRYCLTDKLVNFSLKNIEMLEKNPEYMKIGLYNLKGLINDTLINNQKRYGQEKDMQFTQKQSSTKKVYDSNYNNNRMAKFRNIPLTNNIIY